MWFLVPLLVILVLINWTVVLEHRWTVGGFPLNVFDGVLAVGVLLALIPFKGGKTSVAHTRTHPLLWPILVVFGAAIAFGFVTSASTLAEPRWIITDARNMVALPLSVFIGYRLTLSFSTCKWLIWTAIGAGAAVGIEAALSFIQNGQQVYSLKSVNVLRETQYVHMMGGIVAALLLFSVVAQVRALPLWVAVPVAIICFGGDCATLSRSDWAAILVTFCAVFFIVPRERRLTGMALTAVGIVVLLVSLWVGVLVADQIVGHDLPAVLEDRVASMLPGYQRTSHRSAAWDTRMPGIYDELALFAGNPLVGRGFGIQDVEAYMHGNMSGSYRHNTWTSTLAATGLVGFTAMIMVFAGMTVAGWRMVKDRLDRTTVLIGALGVLTSVYWAWLGMCSMTFNTQREAMVVGLLCGVVLRCRAMQLAVKASVDEEVQSPAPEGPYVPWRWPGRVPGNV
jgi:hypothetical protein